MRLGAVVRTELLKLRRSKVTWLTWLAFSIAYSIVPLSTGIAGPRMSVLEPGSYAVVLLVFAAGVGATVWQVRSADDTQ